MIIIIIIMMMMMIIIISGAPRACFARGRSPIAKEMW